MAKGDEFKPRRAEPEQSFDYNDADGKLIRMKADSDGLVEIKNAAQARAADAFGLSEARIEAKSTRAARRAEKKAAAEAPEPTVIPPTPSTTAEAGEE